MGGRYGGGAYRRTAPPEYKKTKEREPPPILEMERGPGGEWRLPEPPPDVQTEIERKIKAFDRTMEGLKTAVRLNNSLAGSQVGGSGIDFAIIMKTPGQGATLFCNEPMPGGLDTIDFQFTGTAACLGSWEPPPQCLPWCVTDPPGVTGFGTWQRFGAIGLQHLGRPIVSYRGPGWRYNNCYAIPTGLYPDDLSELPTDPPQYPTPRQGPGPQITIGPPPSRPSSGDPSGNQKKPKDNRKAAYKPIGKFTEALDTLVCLWKAIPKWQDGHGNKHIDYEKGDRPADYPIPLHRPAGGKTFPGADGRPVTVPSAPGDSKSSVPRPQEMIEDIMTHPNDIDWGEFAKCMVENHIQDFLIGWVNKKISRGGMKYSPQRPIGLTGGCAL